MAVALDAFLDKVEDRIGVVARPVRPFVPVVARLLIVSVFVEDALRIFFNWNLQMDYFYNRLQYPYALILVGLFLNVALQLVGAALVVAAPRKWLGAVLLIADIHFQLLFYQHIFDISFVLRFLALGGGLLLLISDAVNTKSRDPFAGLPALTNSQGDLSMHLQFVGRILLVLLFLGLMIRSHMGTARVFTTVVGFILCVLVVVGYKARISATILVLSIGIINPFVHPYWQLAQYNPLRDFVKYDFYISLSVMGGFLLLANLGPGAYSIDHNKKKF